MPSRALRGYLGPHSTFGYILDFDRMFGKLTERAKNARKVAKYGSTNTLPGRVQISESLDRVPSRWFAVLEEGPTPAGEGSDRLFQFLDSYWRSPESCGVW